MKQQYLLLLICAGALIITSCKKSSPGNAISGKWQETKLRIYGDSLGVITYDTTYTQPFTAADYIQFNFNGTCTVSSDHYYYPNTLGYPKTPTAVPAIAATFQYSASGPSSYTLVQQNAPANFSGITTTITIKMLSANTLVQQVVTYSRLPGINQESDSYYQKE
jgi:hypothetical protein